MRRGIVFGGTGTLGAEIVRNLVREGWDIIVASRTSQAKGILSLQNPSWTAEVASMGKLDGVVWAQGINKAGSLISADVQDIRDALEANVIFIAETVKKLVQADLLAQPSRGVIISSIWQEFARENKAAYLVSKSALSGLIPSMALDFAEQEFSINAVLPGVIDTPMTRSQLTVEQIQRVENGTPGGILAEATHVANAVNFLLSTNSQGINGQSIVVDNGWSIKREI